MLDEKKRTVRFETSSLLPLKLVLSEAEKESPSRAAEGFTGCERRTCVEINYEYEEGI